MTSKLSDVVSKVAPLLGSAISVVNPMAGLLVKGIGSLFGSPASEDDLINRISQDPEAALKLKQFEIEHQYDLQRMYFQDTADARSRNVEVTKATGKNDTTLSILAYVFVGGFFIYSFLLFFVHIDTTAHDIILLIAGQISSMAITVAGFFFGSMFKTHAHIPPTNQSQINLPPPAQTR